VLAHQGGWDELLLPMAVLFVVFGVPWLLKRRRVADHGLGEGDRCAYCGAPFAAGARRCSECGFRAVPHQPTSSTI
jgi:hypothetical protein